MQALLNVKALVEANLSGFEASATQLLNRFPLSMTWIGSDLSTGEGNKASSLLLGAKVALLETAAAWAVGYNRAASGSARTYTEHCFAWLYYKDHPVEFAMVERKEGDLFLPKATQAYLKSIDKGFEGAYKYLRETSSRPSEYFYTDLSYHVHAHPGQIISGKEAEELVVTSPPEVSFLQVCAYVDEFISDNYLAFYRHSWGSFPEKISTHAQQRLGNKLAKFIASQ